MKIDVAIIGGGVVGALVARELSRYKVEAVLLEAGADVCSGASRANSGIVHAGHDAEEGSRKAYFNVRGNRAMYDLCDELGVKCGKIGSLVVAYHKDELPTLQNLKERGMRNGVQNLTLLNKNSLFETEPNIASHAQGALLAADGGIVCPYELTFAAMGNAMDNGVMLKTNFAVTEAHLESDGRVLLTALSGETVSAKVVINCAGQGAAEVANLLGDSSFTIAARKGEYLLLDKGERNTVTHTVFSCPTKAGKGVLITPTVDGNILLGPTSVPSFVADDTSVTEEGIHFLRTKAQSMVKELHLNSVITSFCGVRAYSQKNDFVIEWSNTCNVLFNVAGIESPGLTSAPAIADYVANQIAERLQLTKNTQFSPFREPYHFFKLLSDDEKNKLIACKPSFGQIVCRCEEVTLGEMIRAVRANPPATTIDGIKLRTRGGMGRCQGGFCQPQVLKLLAQECGIPLCEVTKNGKGSFVLCGETK